MDTFVVTKSTVWGNSRTRGAFALRRLAYKQAILCKTGLAQFVDHSKVYAYKPIGQKGPAKETQTFIVAYPYISETLNEKEKDFIDLLDRAELRYYKEPCAFRGIPAYRILIMDTDIDLDAVLKMIPEPGD